MRRPPPSRNSLGTAAVVGLFLTLALLFVLMRTGALAYAAAALAALHDTSTTGFSHPLANDWAGVCDRELRPCLRASGPLALQAIQALLHLLMAPFYWDLSRSFFEPWTPWPQASTGPLIQLVLIPFAARLAFGILCLTPLLAAALTLFRGTTSGLLFLAVAFGSLFGWHPGVITAFFTGASTLADWPRSYYLFEIYLQPYDMFALGVVGAALLYAGTPHRQRLWATVLLAALAQLTIEHLGFVVGVMLAAAELVQPGRIFRVNVKAAIRQLALVGLVSIATALASIPLFFLSGHATAYDSVEGARALITNRWLPTNLQWLKVVVANVLTMMVPALAGGLVCGLGLGKLEPQTDDCIRRMTAAGFGGLAAFWAVMGVGLLFLAYPAEMGRQFIPSMLLAGLSGLVAGRWTMSRFSS